MIMKFIFTPLLLAALLIGLLTGCNSLTSGNKQNDSVYLDLGVIARALGRDELIEQRQKVALDQLNTQLLQISEDLNKQLEEEKLKLGKKPGEAEKQQFNVVATNANKQLQQSQLLAKQKLITFKQQLIRDFKNEVKSAAQPIAKNRGAISVTIIDNNILWFDPSADITDEVIATLRARTESDIKVSGTHTESTSEKATHNDELQKLDNLVNQIEKESVK